MAAKTSPSQLSSAQDQPRDQPMQEEQQSTVSLVAGSPLVNSTSTSEVSTVSLWVNPLPLDCGVLSTGGGSTKFSLNVNICNQLICHYIFNLEP